VTTTITLDDLCRPWLPGEAPWLDQLDAVHPRLSGMQRRWLEDGLVILEPHELLTGPLLPRGLIEQYERAWLADNGGRLTGWPCDTPYTHTPALLDLCMTVGPVLEHLIGEPMGLHLNLTGWRSTTRNWHPDGVLNPDTTADFYAAVWFALEDIDADAGPFEYVPGSHREFGIVRQDLVLKALGTDVTNTSWPRDSERLLTDLFDRAIAERGLEVRQFVPKRGSILVWHPRLIHRGSIPRNPELERRALIAHYSGVRHRIDMPPAVPHNEGHFFPINQDHSAC
jgi:hypothetical protein